MKEAKLYPAQRGAGCPTLTGQGGKCGGNLYDLNKVIMRAKQGGYDFLPWQCSFCIATKHQSQIISPAKKQSLLC
jgi:hypothetical protein